MDTTPVIFIVGPTASGKTALAIEAAKSIGGEIICADSRTVYKGLDIGTAKPTAEERAAVPHHLLDIVEPNQHFTAADFQKLARQKIEEIKNRGKVPMLVGGTGLYVDGVLFDYKFAPPPDPAFREKLKKMTLEELQKHCADNNIPLPTNSSNKRHVIRAIEQGGINHNRKQQSPKNTLVVGIATKKNVLQKRIAHRAEQMFNDGVVEEATTMAIKYGWENEAMTGNIYRLVHRIVKGEIDQKTAKDLFIRSDMHLAKRQMTWFRRNPHIEWFDDRRAALSRINEFVEQLSRNKAV